MSQAIPNTWAGVSLSSFQTSPLRHPPIAAEMHFPTTLITTLLLASTSTLAIKLPSNFTIIEVIPIDPEYMYDEAKDNPYVPLVNATLRCGRKYMLAFEDYTLEGEFWSGVSEKQLKNAAKQGGLMTKWKFESWPESACDPEITAENQTCVHKNPGWRAKFRKPMLFGRPEVLLTALEKLTGMYGHDYTAVEFLMSNGTELMSSSTWEDYPEEGKWFNC